MPNPSGASQPTKGVPTPNPTDDPTAKAKEDHTLQQNIIDELKAVRERMSSMMGEEMKEMRGKPAVITGTATTPSIEERDRRDERRKLEEREAFLEKELRGLRLDPVTYMHY